MSETTYANPLVVRKDLRLSVVTPFFKNDPSLLINILSKQGDGKNIELIIIDDGSGMADLTAQVMAQIDRFPAPARLITLHDNVGRSGARNRLIAQAKAPYVLFLDSDMAPDTDHFLDDWLALIDTQLPTIAYGGFTTKQVPDLPELALARALAERMDCQNARQRAARGGMALATSNLVVRTDILAEVRFDSDFVGWGWEDVDWALRASKAGYAIAHVEIPATHMGLDRADVVLDKFAKAGPNFRLIQSRHPDMSFTSGTRVAKLMSKLPFTSLLRGMFRRVALTEGLPMQWRSIAARAWRASWVR
jgi:glycosyltransferase involved in cell wall biosynthesis